MDHLGAAELAWKDRGSSRGELRPHTTSTFIRSDVSKPLGRKISDYSLPVGRICRLLVMQPESMGMNCSFGRGLLSESKRRAAILRTVFRLLDHKDTQLLLKVARIIIAVSTL